MKTNKRDKKRSVVSELNEQNEPREGVQQSPPGTKSPYIYIKNNNLKGDTQSARSTLDKEVGELTNTPSRDSQSPPSTPSTPVLLLDPEQQLKHLHVATGIIDYNQPTYYFGMNLLTYYDVKVKIRNKEVSKTVKGNKLFFICGDGEVLKADDLKKEGYVIEGDLMQSQSRWNTEDIKAFLNKFSIDSSFESAYNLIKREYEKYIDLSEDEEYDLLPLWDIGTYFFSLFNAYPYIHLHGFKNTGKSKIMLLSSLMTFNAKITSGMTIPVMFRTIEQNRPTLYLDEFEIPSRKQETREDQEFMGLLNNGYKKGLEVTRLEQEGKKWVTRDFRVYCPKMIANISGLRGALTSRCVKVITQRAKPDDERGERYPNENDDIWREVRNELYLLALARWQEVVYKYDAIEKRDYKISNRDWEIWKPIITIASLVSEELEIKMIKFAEKKCEEERKEEDQSDSWEYKLVRAIAYLFMKDQYYYVSEIKAATDVYFDEAQQKPTSHWIGRTLRKFGIKDVKRDGVGTRFMITKHNLNEIIVRLQYEDIEFSNEIKEDKIGET